MNYLHFIGILLFTIVRKTVGLVWYYFVVPFRFYARNTIYNYVLENNIYLARLNERNPKRVSDDMYEIAPFHGSDGGYIKYRKVSRLEYEFVFWFIWGWLDDDSNHDTFSSGFNQTIIDGERKTYLPKFIIKSLIRDNSTENNKVFGNSFDIGDRRKEYPEFGFWSATLWNIRNTGYNFQYKFNERIDQPFCFTINGKLYGWAKEPWETGYKLVLAFTHKGV